MKSGNEAYRLYSNNLMEVEEMIQSPTYASAVMIYDKLGKSDSVYKYCNKIMSVGTPDFVNAPPKLKMVF